MKLRHDEVEPGVVEASVSGELEVHSCTCLSNFWDLRLAGARVLRLDLSGVESADDDGLATFATLLGAQLAEGGRVELRGAPGSVGDVLARAGLADHARLDSRPD